MRDRRPAPAHVTATTDRTGLVVPDSDDERLVSGRRDRKLGPRPLDSCQPGSRSWASRWAGRPTTRRAARSSRPSGRHVGRPDFGRSRSPGVSMDDAVAEHQRGPCRHRRIRRVVAPNTVRINGAAQARRLRLYPIAEREADNPNRDDRAGRSRRASRGGLREVRVSCVRTSSSCAGVDEAARSPRRCGPGGGDRRADDERASSPGAPSATKIEGPWSAGTCFDVIEPSHGTYRASGAAEPRRNQLTK